MSDEALTGTNSELSDRSVAELKHVAPESASSGAQGVAASAQRRPAPFAAGALAVGFLLGWLLGGRRRAS